MIEHTRNNEFGLGHDDLVLKHRYREAPHECSDPACPGNVNWRKLEAFDKMLGALQDVAASGVEFEDSRVSYLTVQIDRSVRDDMALLIAEAEKLAD